MSCELSQPRRPRTHWLRTARAGAALLVILLAGIWANPAVGAVQTPDAFTQNQRLGRGVNILGYDPIWRSREQARFQGKHFGLLHEAGFGSVRINLHPFRHTSRDQGWKLPDAWFATVDWAVTNALSNGLTVILDLHEFNAMAENPEGRHDQFLATWKQLAERYQSAPDGVLFEILNEPSRGLTPELWNRYLKEALALIRKSNPNRTVIVGPPFWNAIGHLQDLELPADDRQLIVTVHYYAPMEFTHQGAAWSTHKDKSNVAWSGSPEERKAVHQDLAKAADWARKENRPIFLGEFGAYDKAPMESRSRYTDAVARTAESFGWSWAYWQLDSDFVLYDINMDAWVQPIRDALIPPGETELRAGRYPGKPFQGRVHSLPGNLECELYDEGGEGVAYHETDGRNHGSGELNKGGSDRDNFRKDENVDISFTKNDWDNSEFNRVPQELGWFYLGWTASGEWVRYTVDIAKAGRYSLGVMYTSRYDGGILLKCDERAAGPPIRLASTADVLDERRNWHRWNYHEQKDAVFLPAGRHVLTIKILDPGNLNLDRIEFIAARESEQASALPVAPDASLAPGPADQLGWQLAVHSWTFQKFSLSEAIDKSAALGVKHMSISGSYNREVDGKLTKLPTPSLTDAEFATIQARMKAKGLSPKFLNMGVVKPGADEAASRKIFEAARRFGIECSSPSPKRTAGWRNCRRSWTWWRNWRRNTTSRWPSTIILDLRISTGIRIPSSLPSRAEALCLAPVPMSATTFGRA